jgi:hypothetical protein
VGIDLDFRTLLVDAYPTDFTLGHTRVLDNCAAERRMGLHCVSWSWLLTSCSIIR